MLKKREDLLGQNEINYKETRGNNYFRTQTNLKKTENDQTT